MPIEIYLNGCACGVNGAYIRKIKRYGRANNITVTIYDIRHEGRTKYNELVKTLAKDWRPSIVVYNDEVKELRSWNL